MEITRKPRFGILSLLLLIAAVASWVGWLSKRADIRRLESAIDEMRPLANELLVQDPSQFALVGRPEAWMDEYIWDVHIPIGDEYQLCGSYDDIIRVKFADNQPLDVIDLPPGKHTIELRQPKQDSQYTTLVLVDGMQVFEQQHASDWKTGTGSTITGRRQESMQQSTSHALRVFQLSFNSGGPGQPTANGILLWIRKKP